MWELHADCRRCGLLPGLSAGKPDKQCKLAGAQNPRGFRVSILNSRPYKPPTTQGYVGENSLCVNGAVRNAAYSAEGLALEFYKSLSFNPRPGVSLELVVTQGPTTEMSGQP